MSCLKLNSSLSDKIKLASSIGTFICPACDKYSTNSNDEFIQHVNEFHSNIETIQCVYCTKIVNKQFIIPHIQFHYRDDVKSKFKCTTCCDFISIACLDDIFDHIMHFHRYFSCINCDEHFNSDQDLNYHIKNKYTRFYHCKMSNCKLKTVNYFEILNHLQSGSHVEFTLENIMLCNPTKIDVIPDTVETNERIKNNAEKYNNIDLLPYTNQLMDESICNTAIPEKAAKFNEMNMNDKATQEIHELVFLKDDFMRSNITQCNDLSFTDKLNSVGKHKIGKYINNDYKIYSCMSCTYTSRHSFNDVKKHILSQHCFIHYTDIPVIMKFISCQFHHQRSPCNTSSFPAETTIKIPITRITGSPKANKIKPLKTKADDKMKTYHSLGIPYSQGAFNTVYANENDIVKQNLLNKLHQLDNCLIKVNMNIRPKLFICGHCSFESNHSIVDVKRHVMRIHCGIEGNLIQDFCKLTKVDKDWNILSDQIIIDLFDGQTCCKNQVNSKTNATMKKQEARQKSFENREIMALMNIRNRKRKLVIES